MRVLFTIVLISLFGALLVNSCSIAPSFDDVPVISNPRVTLTSNPFNVGGRLDSVVLEFDFTDGDGDIGYDDDDPGYITFDSIFVDTVLVDSLPFDTTYNFLKLRENRIPHVYTILPYFQDTSTLNKIPRIPANGGVDDISGTVRITIPSTSLLLPCITVNPPPTDEMVYSIFIEDRAFNRSNTLTFNPIKLDCP